jgi:hypothetical protein
MGIQGGTAISFSPRVGKHKVRGNTLLQQVPPILFCSGIESINIGFPMLFQNFGFHDFHSSEQLTKPCCVPERASCVV